MCHGGKSSSLKRATPNTVRLLTILACGVVMPLAAHVAFSRLGFNPTDDGFILAYSRRLLDGQVPHRDFISIRPVLSPLLHTPILAIWKYDAFLASRFFVWCEFAIIALAWTHLLEKRIRFVLKPIEFVVLSVLAFTTSAHLFPIMAWHTIDGIFLATLGVLLSMVANPAAQALGYFLVGSSCLCKQNFAAMIPVLLATEGRLKSARHWTYCLLPALLYIGTAIALGTLNDTITQLCTVSDLFRYGIGTYVLRTPALGIGLLIGYCVLNLVAQSAAEQEYRKRRAVIVSASLILALTLVSQVRIVAGGFGWNSAFAILGLAVGVLIFATGKAKDTEIVRIGILVVGLAWCASVSVGYNTPALMSGPLLAYVIICWMVATYRSNMQMLITRFWRPALMIMLAVSISCFSYGRLNHVYRERPYRELTYRLDVVVPGLKGIVTNQTTYRFLKDLARIAEHSKNKSFCVLPDCAAVWVASKQPNPLPIDWVYHLELSRNELAERVITDIKKERGRLIVIVQKFAASSLALPRLEPAEQNSVVLFCRKHLRKVGETQFFELYE